MHTSQVSIDFPQRNHLSEGSTIVAADVGGTKTDLALFRIQDGDLTMLREARLPSQQFGSFDEMMAHFLGETKPPQRLSIAFAGPVLHGKAKATNLDWSIDCDELSKTLQVPEVLLINDLEALAYGLASLSKQDLQTIYAGQKVSNGNAAIIAPGTGLGEATLFWNGKAYAPFATEGGHTDFAPRNEFDMQFLEYLQTQFGHVSWERVVSGPGILQIFHFLRDFKKWEDPDWLRKEMSENDPTASIAYGAEEGCPICIESLRLFVRYLATVASNLALQIEATGGIFIGGGIVPKIWDDHLKDVFLEHFIQVGRLRPLVEAIPVYLILNPKTALLGAAFYGK